MSSTDTNQASEELLTVIMSCSSQVYIPNDTKDYTGVEIGVNVLELKEAIDQHTKTMCERALDQLHYDIMDGKYRPPEGTTDPAFYYAQFHRIIDERIAELQSSPNKREDSDE